MDIKEFILNIDKIVVDGVKVEIYDESGYGTIRIINNIVILDYKGWRGKLK